MTICLGVAWKDTNLKILGPPKPAARSASESDRPAPPPHFSKRSYAHGRLGPQFSTLLGLAAQFGSTRVCLAPPKTVWVYLSLFWPYLKQCVYWILFGPTQNGLGLLEYVWPHTTLFQCTRACLTPLKTVWIFSNLFGRTQNGWGLLESVLALPITVWVHSNLFGSTQNGCLLECVWPHPQRFGSTLVCLAPSKMVCELCLLEAVWPHPKCLGSDMFLPSGVFLLLSVAKYDSLLHFWALQFTVPCLLLHGLFFLVGSRTRTPWKWSKIRWDPGSEVQGSESDLWPFSYYSDEIINKLDSYLTEGC